MLARLVLDLGVLRGRDLMQRDLARTEQVVPRSVLVEDPHLWERGGAMMSTCMLSCPAASWSKTLTCGKGEAP